MEKIEKRQLDEVMEILHLPGRIESIKNKLSIEGSKVFSGFLSFYDSKKIKDIISVDYDRVSERFLQARLSSIPWR
jgi:hypothetical protein